MVVCLVWVSSTERRNRKEGRKEDRSKKEEGRKEERTNNRKPRGRAESAGTSKEERQEE